jgi:hypothetical protein
MLQKLTEEIAECYGHARECQECAKQALDATAQSEFLEMEQRWIMLARSYELSERISNFQAEVRRREK